jgi:Tfp pilus assembly pilus retraction ATPase PilT
VSEPASATADLIRQFRDWRIDTSDPRRSVVFVPTDQEGGKVAPFSTQAPGGVNLTLPFYSVAFAIEEHRRKHLQAGDDPRSFAIEVDGVRCRVERMEDSRFHVRVVANLLEFDQLRVPAPIGGQLLSRSLDAGGLVIICGTYGSGKTTTVNSTVRERVRRFGGLALVLGRPVEYQYAGFHGRAESPGYVEQVDLVGRNLCDEIKSAMRSFAAGAPGALAFPELTSADGAGEMLRAANRGNLVFADMHAANVEAAIINLVAMAERDGERFARELLGNALRLVVHQRMRFVTAQHSFSVVYEALAPTKAMSAAIQNQAIQLHKAIAHEH